MGTETQPYYQQLPKYVFAASFLVSLFWITGNYTNIYAYKLTGAIFEILWLPMLLLVFALPAIAIIFWYKQQFSRKSLYLWSLLMIALAAVLIAAK